MERIPATASQSSTPIASGGNAHDEVERLIALGKCKQAVELAKEQHKRGPTEQTERRLFQAYLARIEQFQDKRMNKEAHALLELVRERFPHRREELLAQEVRDAAAEGRIHDLVAPLVGGAARPEVCACIEASVRRHLIDVAGLAACEALSFDHRLRVAAAAIWRAFEAVTTGAVTDEQIALPEVSHRSPLAAWKMLVRAIAAFYRDDDEGCTRALDAMPADAAAARLAPVLRAMMQGTPLSGAGRALGDRVVADDRSLRMALEGIEKAFQWMDLKGLGRSIRDAVSACASAQPELLERLRQHISVACVLRDVPSDVVLRAMGPSRKDSYFWRSLARVSETEGGVAIAALYWERFARHAVAEGMFSERSLEAAQVWLHMAELLSSRSEAELRAVRRRFGERAIFADYYRGQPPQIAAVAPRSDQEVVEIALSPGDLFSRAADIHPAAEIFRQWWSWAEKTGLPDARKKGVAQRWHEKLPADPQPLLILSELAEQRNALKLALAHLSAAEALDGLNPQVRQARVRLALATTWRHFRQTKPQLVEKDLAELTALPGMDHGDLAAFVTAMRAAWHALRDDQPAAQQHASRVIEQAGTLAGIIILESVAKMAHVQHRAAWPQSTVPALPDPHELAHAEARTIRLMAEMRVRRLRPAHWGAILNDVLRERSCPLAQAELLAIGASATQNDAHLQAYLASSAGLAGAGDPAAMARFLLLRAQSLVTPWARQRAAQCLSAALELARQTHEAQLLDEIFAQIDRLPVARDAIVSGESGRALDEQTLADVLKLEREAKDFPRDAADASRHLARPMEDQDFDASLPFDEEDDEDDNIPFDAPNTGPFGGLDIAGLAEDLGPQDLESLARMVERKGRLPTPDELLNSNPKLLFKVLAAIGGIGKGAPGLDESLDPRDESPAPGFFASVFGRRKRKHKKKRR